MSGGGNPFLASGTGFDIYGNYVGTTGGNSPYMNSAATNGYSPVSSTMSDQSSANAFSGAATGAATGSAFGPVGSAVGGVLGAIGGGLEASSATDAANKQLAQQYNLGQQQISYGQQNASQQLLMQQAQQANALQRQMQMAPLRDQTMYALQQRMGMSPTAFQPRDMFNPQSAGNQNPSQGGIDLNQLAAQNAAYKPGAGGVSGNQSLQNQLMQTLGYTPNAQGQYGYSGARGFNAQQDLLNRGLMPGVQNYGQNMEQGVAWDANKQMFVPQNAPTYAGNPGPGQTVSGPKGGGWNGAQISAGTSQNSPFLAKRAQGSYSGVTGG